MGPWALQGSHRSSWSPQTLHHVQFKFNGVWHARRFQELEKLGEEHQKEVEEYLKERFADVPFVTGAQLHACFVWRLDKILPGLQGEFHHCEGPVACVSPLS